MEKMDELIVLRNSASPIYFRICQDSSNNYLSFLTKLDDFILGVKGTHETLIRFLETYDKFDREKIISVVFGALCLEAFIFDYAAQNLTTTFAKKYLDKPNLVEKWVIVPRFVLGKDFPRDSQAFQNIRDFKKRRDKFIHTKSETLINPPKLKEIIRQKPKRSLEEHQIEIKLRREGKKKSKIFNPYKAILAVFTELRKLEEETDNIQDWWGINTTDKKSSS